MSTLLPHPPTLPACFYVAIVSCLALPCLALPCPTLPCLALPCLAAGSFLQPDEVSFAVMLRGYGASNPPAWPQIDAWLSRMRTQYGMEPTSSGYKGHGMA
jgi:hypothetical protein